MRSVIALKLIVDLPDKASAVGFETIVGARFASLVDVRHSETVRYWKIRKWFMILFTVEPIADPASAFDGILGSLGEGWQRHDFSSDEQWAVWDPKTAASSFFSPAVRWAGVERFPASSYDPA